MQVLTLYHRYKIIKRSNICKQILFNGLMIVKMIGKTDI